MQSLFCHYRVGRFSLVFSASVYASLRLTEQVCRPTIERIWRKLTSDEALDLYAYCIVFLTDMALLMGKLAIALAHDLNRAVIDPFVQSHLKPEPTPILPPVEIRHGDEFVDAGAIAPSEPQPIEPPTVVDEPIAAVPVESDAAIATTETMPAPKRKAKTKAPTKAPGQTKPRSLKKVKRVA